MRKQKKSDIFTVINNNIIYLYFLFIILKPDKCLKCIYMCRNI